jgi:hypothetical protein
MFFISNSAQFRAKWINLHGGAKWQKNIMVRAWRLLPHLSMVSLTKALIEP